MSFLLATPAWLSCCFVGKYPKRLGTHFWFSFSLLLPTRLQLSWLSAASTPSRSPKRHHSTLPISPSPSKKQRYSDAGSFRGANAGAHSSNIDGLGPSGLTAPVAVVPPMRWRDIRGGGLNAPVVVSGKTKMQAAATAMLPLRAMGFHPARQKLGQGGASRGPSPKRGLPPTPGKQQRNSLDLSFPPPKRGSGAKRQMS